MNLSADDGSPGLFVPIVEIGKEGIIGQFSDLSKCGDIETEIGFLLHKRTSRPLPKLALLVHGTVFNLNNFSLINEENLSDYRLVRCGKATISVDVSSAVVNSNPLASSCSFPGGVLMCGRDGTIKIASSTPGIPLITVCKSEKAPALEGLMFSRWRVSIGDYSQVFKIFFP